MIYSAFRPVLVSAVLCCLAMPALAQISIPSSFYAAKAGDREMETEYEADNPACANSLLAASGAGQTWDFTGCAFSSPPLLTYTDYGTDVAGDVPMGDNPAFGTANFYAREYETDPTSEASSWGVIELTASAAKGLGAVGVEVAPPDYDTTLVVYTPVPTSLVLPLAYLASWYDSTSFTIGTDVFATAEDNLIDGWGTLITPAGSFNALRLASVRRSWAFILGTPLLVNTQYKYEFLTVDDRSAFIYHDNLGTADGAGHITSALAPLPVELASFIVIRDGRKAHLAWRTLSESNNSGFGVEHALGSEPFTEVAFVDGAGTSNREVQYGLSIDLVETGVHRFRLRQVDLDGTFSYSRVAELAFETPERFALLQAYPNPFNPVTTITFELASAGDVTLDVYDSLGQRIARLISGIQQAGRHEVEFDAAGLPSGLYLYRMVAGSHSETRSMMLLK